MGKGGKARSGSVTVAELAKLLDVSQETIRRHVDEGAPADGGRINPIYYAAWLLGQLAAGPDTTASTGDDAVAQ